MDSSLRALPPRRPHTSSLHLDRSGECILCGLGQGEAAGVESMKENSDSTYLPSETVGEGYQYMIYDKPLSEVPKTRLPESKSSILTFSLPKYIEHSDGHCCQSFDLQTGQSTDLRVSQRDLSNEPKIAGGGCNFFFSVLFEKKHTVG